MLMSSKALTAKARDFIHKNRAGALATVSKESVPHVAVVYSLIEPDLTLYFITRVESVKYVNLTVNPTVSMSFSNEKTMITVQLTGRAEVVDDLKEYQDLMYRILTLRHSKHFSANPPMQLLQRGATSELAVIKVTPTKMVYANFKPLSSGKYKPFFSEVI